MISDEKVRYVCITMVTIAVLITTCSIIESNNAADLIREGCTPHFEAGTGQYWTCPDPA